MADTTNWGTEAMVVPEETQQTITDTLAHHPPTFKPSRKLHLRRSRHQGRISKSLKSLGHFK